MKDIEYHRNVSVYKVFVNTTEYHPRTCTLIYHAISDNVINAIKCVKEFKQCSDDDILDVESVVVITEHTLIDNASLILAAQKK